MVFFYDAVLFEMFRIVIYSSRILDNMWALASTWKQFKYIILILRRFASWILL